MRCHARAQPARSRDHSEIRPGDMSFAGDKYAPVVGCATCWPRPNNLCALDSFLATADGIFGLSSSDSCSFVRSFVHRSESTIPSTPRQRTRLIYKPRSRNEDAHCGARSLAARKKPCAPPIFLSSDKNSINRPPNRLFGGRAQTTTCGDSKKRKKIIHQPSERTAAGPPGCRPSSPIRSSSILLPIGKSEISVSEPQDRPSGRVCIHPSVRGPRRRTQFGAHLKRNTKP